MSFSSRDWVSISIRRAPTYYISRSIHQDSIRITSIRRTESWISRTVAYLIYPTSPSKVCVWNLNSASPPKSRRTICRITISAIYSLMFSKRNIMIYIKVITIISQVFNSRFTIQWIISNCVVCWYISFIILSS